MNFDQLKSDWHREDERFSEEISALQLKLRAAKTPMDKIRKQMKWEFFFQIMGMLIMLFFPVMINMKAETEAIFYIFYAASVAFTLYYSYKFYKFYKNSYNLNVDMRNNVLWFYYEMKINIEMYKGLTYILTFIFFTFGIFYFNQKNMFVHFKVSNWDLRYSALCSFAIILIMGMITEFWVSYSYKKHLKDVEAILKSLDED